MNDQILRYNSNILIFIALDQARSIEIIVISSTKIPKKCAIENWKK